MKLHVEERRPTATATVAMAAVDVQVRSRTGFQRFRFVVEVGPVNNIFLQRLGEQAQCFKGDQLLKILLLKAKDAAHTRGVAQHALGAAGMMPSLSPLVIWRCGIANKQFPITSDIVSQQGISLLVVP